MVKLLRAIEGLREKSEAERLRILVVAVAVTVLVIGVIWGFSVRAQLAQISSSQQPDTEGTEELPSPGEIFKENAAALSDSSKALLRDLLLGEEEATDPIPPPPSDPRNEVPIRLPSSE